MARGPSGRVVIEVEPELKRELHAALVAEGTTLKDWFIAHALEHLRARREPGFPGFSGAGTVPFSKVADDETPYRAAPKPSENPSSQPPSSHE